MSSFLHTSGSNWQNEVSKLRRMGASMPNSPTQARAEAMNMQAAVNNRSLTASMNRSRMANYRGRQFTGFQGSNMQIALPKVRQPLGTMADKGIPFNVEDDEELKSIRRWSRLFYATHDLVPLLIDIYSKFPVVGLEFDSKDPLIKKFYEEMFLGELNYLEFLPDQLGREYFTVGEVTSLAHFNESLGVWSSEEILNPDMLKVSRSLFVQRDRVQLLVKELVENLRQGPENGGGMSDTGETPSERLQRNKEYCCTPETRVLTENLDWVPVGSLALGDKIVAFDEFAPEDGTRTGRRWRGADVTATSIIQAPCYEVQTSQGSVTCTDQHMFLARREPKTGRGNNRGNGFPRSWQWIEAKDLQPGDEIKHMPTWEFEDTYEAGWLAGMFDGEGSLTVTPTTQNLVIYQNEGPVLDRIIEVLKKHKFDIYEQRNRTRNKGVQIYVRGGLTEVMRFIGTFRPERLSSKLAQSFHGKPLASKTLPPTAVVATVTPVGTRDVVALATSTKTLITEGLFSHNTDLVRYYPEIIQAASQNDGLDISDALVSRIVNRSTPWAKRGTPHLLRSFRTLMTEESLNAAQDAVADRLYSPLVLATLGIEDMGDGEPWIPDQSELDDTRDDLQAALAADFRLMVHNFGLKVENVFGRESVPNLDADFERVQTKLLQAWGIGEALISGGTGGAYASSALNREFVTQIMTGFQNSLKRHIIKRAEVIAEAQGHYDYDLKGGVRVPIYREIVEYDEETGEEYIRKVPKLLIPDVKFSTLNLRDEAQERAFISQLKAMGVPVSDKTLAVNIDMEFDQELERQAEESVAKLMATAQAMKKVQDLCDAQNLPYPPELAQHLMSTLQLRQGKTQTELGEAQAVAGEAQAEMQTEQVEMQKAMMEQQMMGAGMAPAPGGQQALPPPDPAQAQAEAEMQGGDMQAPAQGPNVSPLAAPGPGAPGPGNPPAGVYAARSAGLGAINGPHASPPAGAPPSGGVGPELPPGVPEPSEIPRNRQRPEESDSMRGNTPKQAGRIRGGPSSWGRSRKASEEQVEGQVKRLEVVANWDFSVARHPKVSDLVNDPKFYRALNMETYRGQLQADWPEILAGGADDSKRILDDMLAQFFEIFGVEPEW